MPLISIVFNFGSGKAGLSTVGYQIFDSNNVALPRTQENIRESGNGAYSTIINVLDGFTGFVRGDTGEVTPRYDEVAINFSLPLATAPPLYDSPPIFRQGDSINITFEGGDCPNATPIIEPDLDDIPNGISAIIPVFSAG